MIPQHLITSALNLTGKKMEDMNIWKIIDSTKFEGIERGRYEEFSIEKFCYFLLSPEFIEKYAIHIDTEEDYRRIAWHIGYCIFEYQSGNERPLISLLEKIGNKI